TSIENVLKVFPYNGQRFRIIHAQLINDSLLERMKKLPLVVDIQPSFVSTDLHWIKERLGENRLSKGAYAWKTMLDAGLILTGGSDCPVVSYNPFEGIFASVTRQDFKGYPESGWYPEENLSVYVAICLFSKNAAYATGKEDVLGTIENGKLADFIVIDRDPFLIKPLDILQVKVLKTYVGGEES
ncbi:MAG: putative amidohydrolase YtcJ, partial [Clostridium sp.]